MGYSKLNGGQSSVVRRRTSSSKQMMKLIAYLLAIAGVVGIALCYCDFADANATDNASDGTPPLDGTPSPTTEPTAFYDENTAASKAVEVNSQIPSSRPTSIDSLTTTTSRLRKQQVIFSRYMEGRGNNKAVEIKNVGTVTVKIPDITVERYANSKDKGVHIQLSGGYLATGETFILCYSEFTGVTHLSAKECDQKSASLSHSGNDALVLNLNGKPLDVIGNVGAKSNWKICNGMGSTKDNTLVRKESILLGNLDGLPSNRGSEWDGIAGDVCEWNIFAIDMWP